MLIPVLAQTTRENRTTQMLLFLQLPIAFLGMEDQGGNCIANLARHRKAYFIRIRQHIMRPAHIQPAFARVITLVVFDLFLGVACTMTSSVPVECACGVIMKNALGCFVILYR